MKSVERILLVSLSNIGDAILTTPVLEVLHRHWPQARLTLLVGPRAVALFERDPRVAEVIPYEKQMTALKRLQWLYRLRAARYDVVVDLRNSLLPYWMGARLTSPFFRPAPRHVHRSQVHLDLVRRMGIDCNGASMHLYAGPEDEAEIDHRLAAIPAGAPVIAVAPGARSHIKRWRADYFARVCDRLIEQSAAQIILVGDSQDHPIAQEVIQKMHHPVLDWTGRTSLREMVALFKRTSLVLTNDSACLHIAAAVGAPLVAIFGPTDPVKYGPVNPRDEVVRLGLVCSPCEQALCAYEHECMNLLEVREVLSAVKRRLAQ